MRVVFNKTFQTSVVPGNGFRAGEVYDLSPSAAAYWKSLGVAEDAPPEPSPPELEPAESPAADTPTEDPADPPAEPEASVGTRSRRRP